MSGRGYYRGGPSEYRGSNYRGSGYRGSSYRGGYSRYNSYDHEPYYDNRQQPSTYDHRRQSIPSGEARPYQGNGGHYRGREYRGRGGYRGHDYRGGRGGSFDGGYRGSRYRDDYGYEQAQEYDDNETYERNNGSRYHEDDNTDNKFKAEEEEERQEHQQQPHDQHLEPQHHHHNHHQQHDHFNQQLLRTQSPMEISGPPDIQLSLLGIDKLTTIDATFKSKLLQNIELEETMDNELIALNADIHKKSQEIEELQRQLVKSSIQVELTQESLQDISLL